MEDAQLVLPLILFGAGLMAGFINVIAGGGSFITLPALIFAGLDPATANGTNRIGVLLQNAYAGYNFRKIGYEDTHLGLKWGLWTLPGAIAGTFFALQVDPIWFRRIVALMMIFAIWSLLFEKKPPSESQPEDPPKPKWYAIPAMIGAGLYGGFIQAGVGIFLMAILSRVATRDLVRINSYKVAIVALFTLPAMIGFALGGRVNWALGLTLSLGTMTGGRIAARFQAKKGGRWVKRLLIPVFIIMGLKLVGWI